MATDIWDRVLNFLGFEEEEDDVPDGGRPDAERRPVLPSPVTRRDQAVQRRPPKRPVVPLDGTRRAWEPGGGRQRVVLVAPRNFESAQDAADHLKAGKPVVLNLEDVDRELAQRLVDFLSGSVYALNGEMHRLAATVLLFAPQGVDVDLPAGLHVGVHE